VVLGELGLTISSAFNKVLKSPTLDEQQLEEMLTEITNALVASDVELALAQQFRDAVRKDVDFQNQPAGINKRRVIQSVRNTTQGQRTNEAGFLCLFSSHTPPQHRLSFNT
jgi:signal recognition particle GTPase